MPDPAPDPRTPQQEAEYLTANVPEPWRAMLIKTYHAGYKRAELDNLLSTLARKNRRHA